MAPTPVLACVTAARLTGRDARCRRRPRQMERRPLRPGSQRGGEWSSRCGRPRVVSDDFSLTIEVVERRRVRHGTARRRPQELDRRFIGRSRRRRATSRSRASPWPRPATRRQCIDADDDGGIAYRFSRAARRSSSPEASYRRGHKRHGPEAGEVEGAPSRRVHRRADRAPAVPARADPACRATRRPSGAPGPSSRRESAQHTGRSAERTQGPIGHDSPAPDGTPVPSSPACSLSARSRARAPLDDDGRQDRRPIAQHRCALLLVPHQHHRRPWLQH